MTAVYDTVRHLGLTCKLLDTHHREWQTKHIAMPENGVPLGSVLAPFFYNIYAYNLPFLVSKKNAHDDDLALLDDSNNKNSRVVKPRFDHIFRIPPDLETKLTPLKSNNDSLPS